MPSYARAPIVHAPLWPCERVAALVSRCVSVARHSSASRASSVALAASVAVSVCVASSALWVFDVRYPPSATRARNSQRRRRRRRDPPGPGYWGRRWVIAEQGGAEQTRGRSRWARVGPASAQRRSSALRSVVAQRRGAGRGRRGSTPSGRVERVCAFPTLLHAAPMNEQ
jgi:hypothetical protein